jgi:hypothetical protein
MNKQMTLALAVLATAGIGSIGERDAHAACSMTDLCIADDTAQTIAYGGATGFGLSVTVSSGSDAWGIFGGSIVTGYTGTGVWGASESGTGVLGSCPSGLGVSGTSTSSFGVSGSLTGDAPSGKGGVWGDGGTSGDGVHATSANSTGSGITGITTSTGHGVYGKVSTAGAGYAIYGQNTSTAAGAYAGYFNGDTSVASGYSYYYNAKATCVGGFCTSDRTQKKNIEPLSGALDQLLKLKGVSFEWKDPADHGNQANRQTGFIAQDVEEVFPAWVDKNDRGVKGIVLPPLQFAALTVESLRQQQAEIDHLKAELSDLKASRGPRTAFSPETMFVGFGFFAVAGAIAFTRRRREESGSEG